MAKAKRKCWVCPTGDHPGVLGPGKPAANNIVRFCLPCSAKKGSLVERTCPANEKKRAKKAESAKAKAKRKRETKRKQDEKKFFCEGVDLRRRVRALCKLKTWAIYFIRRRKLNVEIRRRDDNYTTGRAIKGYHRTVLTIPRDATRGQAESLILHELAHLAAPSSVHHGKPWRRLYALAAEEAWGVGALSSTSHGITIEIGDEINKKLEARKKRGQEKQRQEESAAKEAAEQEDEAPKAA